MTTAGEDRSATPSQPAPARLPGRSAPSRLLGPDGYGSLSPRWRRRLLDAALVVVAALLVGATALIGRHDEPSEAGMGVAGVVLLAVGIAALPFRHRWPVGALAVVFGTTLSYVSLGYTDGPIWLPLIVALLTVVLAGRRRVAVVTLVAGYLAFPWLGYLIDRDEAPNVAVLVGLAAWLVALLAVGEAIRSRRGRAEEARRSHAEALRRRATDERLRIARELHDVVAHNMSLISIQAGVALHLLDRGDRPEQARESLATIKQASKEALVELRSILGVLRQVDEPDPDASRSPVPTLRRLGDLTDRARAAGIDVEVEVAGSLGDLSELPRPVDLAAYRIVQESLTNVARHSDVPAAEVRIAGRDGGLVVEVLDEGSGQRVSGVDDVDGGNGIAGMRERAASVGGRLEAGPRAGRGFAVRAWLPLGVSGAPEVGGEDPR